MRPAYGEILAAARIMMEGGMSVQRIVRLHRAPMLTAAVRQKRALGRLGIRRFERRLTATSGREIGSQPVDLCSDLLCCISHSWNE